MKTVFACLNIVLLFPCFLKAQDTLNFSPASPPPTVFAVQIKEPINLDGKLEEPSWKLAPVTSEFFRMQPRQGGSYFFKTDVRILFDRRNLYFGVFCHDSAGKKGVRVLDYSRDFSYTDNDEFMIQLDPQNLKRFCVSFQATPLGTQGDMQVFDDQLVDPNWDGLWKVRTSITDSGYFAEFAIPFKSLRYERPKSDSVSWNIAFSRIARRNYEQTVFPAIPQSYSPFRMAYGAELKGLVLPPPSMNLRIQPYTLFQYARTTDRTGKSSYNNLFKVGGEAKWAVNTHTVLDATINTDFAQADVDVTVNNLTRFNLFFPEKRQFFLENQGIFAGSNVTGLKPFFSRAIGLANTQFDADPIPIDAGLRFVDRTIKRTFAGLYVHQEGTDVQSPADFFGVFRYLKNYGVENNFGVMLTGRLDEADVQKGFQQNNNATFTVDGLIRPKNTVTVQYLVSTSRDHNSDSIGFAGNFKIKYFNNKFFWYLQSELISDKYKPGEGFVFQNNVLYTQSVEFFSIRPKKWRWLREWELGFDVNYYQKASDLNFQQANLYCYPIYLVLNNGGIIQYAIRPNWQNIDFDFSLLGLPLEQKRYSYVLHELTYNTDESRMISVTSDYNFGSYYNGHIRTASFGLRLAPSPKISLMANYGVDNLYHFGKNVADIKTSIYSLQLKLAWNPQWLFSAFYQYNSFDKDGQINARLSWQFAPLSYLYIVYNENSNKVIPVKGEALISKISYLKQF